MGRGVQRSYRSGPSKEIIRISKHKERYIIDFSSFSIHFAYEFLHRKDAFQEMKEMEIDCCLVKYIEYDSE